MLSGATDANPRKRKKKAKYGNKILLVRNGVSYSKSKDGMKLTNSNFIRPKPTAGRSKKKLAAKIIQKQAPMIKKMSGRTVKIGGVEFVVDKSGTKLKRKDCE